MKAKTLVSVARSGHIVIPWSKGCDAAEFTIPREFVGFVKLTSTVSNKPHFSCLGMLPQVKGAEIHIDQASVAAAIIAGKVDHGGIRGTWQVIQYAGTIGLRLIPDKIEFGAVANS